MTALTQALLDKATVVHLQPDDVILIGNIGHEALEQGQRLLEEISADLPGKRVVMFSEDINVDLLRDLETKA